VIAKPGLVRLRGNSTLASFTQPALVFR